MIELINKVWGWTGIEAVQMFSINTFGNIIFKNKDGSFWRITPEDLDCHKISKDREELNELMSMEDFSENWEAYDLCEIAREQVGDLDRGEKYCLKLPTVLGGIIEASNLGKIQHEQLIEFSGEMAFRTKDLPDGEKYRILMD